MSEINRRSGFTVDDCNQQNGDYHLDSIKHALETVKSSGEPVRVHAVYIYHLQQGLAEFLRLVKYYGLSCKLDGTSDCYVVEKPGQAYK